MNIKKTFSLLFFLTIFVLSAINGFGLLYQNGAGGGYEGETEGAAKNNTIESMVIDGAGYFLAAYSDVLELLQRVELSDKNGMDYTAAQDVLGNAITNLENARDTYISLTGVAGNTPYNPQVIDKLKQFDYHTFQVNNKLNPIICKEVEAYLVNGDINGTFAKSHAAFQAMIELLKAIEADVCLGKLPSISALWACNQAMSTELLFGQYEAQVFAAVL